MEDVFRHAYRHNIWGDPESVSGPGSGLARTKQFREQIPSLLSDLEAPFLLDAGCGDFNWMREVQPIEQYLGIDIVPELIVHCREKYSAGRRTFMHGDITRDALPRADVILCRDCLVHFSFKDIFAAIDNFKKSQSRYLLATTFIAFSENLDVATGEWRRLNMELHPFNFPPPDRLIDEYCPHPDGADKRLGLWRLENVPD
jgi:SAM-dependent methyltransferase